LKVRDYLKNCPDVDWVYVKEDWPNDRLVVGPFTTPKLDKQRDRVLLTGDRINYIYKFGNLIWEHHSDPKEPVIVLGDCLGIGFDSVGKTYGVWGVKDGSETVDEKWQQILKNGRSGGFSIGGKIPKGSRVCSGKDCVLTDPEVLEVSYTASPANEDAVVYWVNKFAKSVLKKVEAGPDTFEVSTALKRFDAYLTELYSNLPEENTDLTRFVKRPCVMDLQSGFMEAGLKKDEVTILLQDHVDELKKSIVGDQTMTEERDTVQKEDMAPAPTPEVSNAGNEVLQLLRAMVDKLDAILAVQKPTVPSPEPDSGPEPEAEPPAPEAEGEPNDGGPTESPEEKKEKPKETKDKAEKSEPIGEAKDVDCPTDLPSGGADAPPDKEPQNMDGPGGEAIDVTNTPEPEVEKPIGTLDTLESQAQEPIKQPDIPTSTEAIKGLARKPERVSIEDIFKKNGIVHLPVPELRTKVVKTNPVNGMPLKGEGVQDMVEEKQFMKATDYFSNRDNKITLRRN